MDLSFISAYYIPIVVMACLIVGYTIQKSLDFIPNKYIPLILSILGAVVSCIAMKNITLESIVYGAVSGLASTGLHQLFAQIIENGASTKGPKSCKKEKLNEDHQSCDHQEKEENQEKQENQENGGNHDL